MSDKQSKNSTQTAKTEEGAKSQVAAGQATQPLTEMPARSGKRISFFQGVIFLVALVALALGVYQWLSSHYLARHRQVAGYTAPAYAGQIKMLVEQQKQLTAGQKALGVRQAHLQDQLDELEHTLAGKSHASQLRLAQKKWLTKASLALAQMSVGLTQSSVSQHQSREVILDNVQLIHQALVMAGQSTKALNKVLNQLIHHVAQWPALARPRISAQLDALRAQLEALSFKTPVDMAKGTHVKKLPSTSAQPWREAAEDSWMQLKGLLVIQHGKQLQKAVLTQADQLNASRLFLLQLDQLQYLVWQGDEDQYQYALTQLENLIHRYTEDNSAQTQFLQQVKALQGLAVGYPDHDRKYVLDKLAFVDQVVKHLALAIGSAS